MVVVILYSIILHHALRKVIQLKRAAKNHTVGAVSGNLRMHVGNGSLAMPSHTSNSNNVGSVVEMSRKTSAIANGGPGALSDTEEPLQPKTRGKGIFNFLSR